LRIERENFDDSGDRQELTLLGLARKRYAGFDPSGRIARRSDHGLAHLLNPLGPDGDDWIDDAYQWARAMVEGTEPALPAWAGRMAVAAVPASTPGLVAQLGGLVSPFGFALTCYPSPLGVTPDGIADQPRLIAPYETDPERWPYLDWVDVHSRQRVPVWPGRGLDAPPGTLAVMTYAHKLHEWANLPVHTRGLPDGSAAGPHTAGWLTPRAVHVVDTRYLGKEAAFYLLRTLGIAVDTEVQTTYGDDVWTSLVLPAAATIPPAVLAAAAGVHPGHLPRILGGTATPRAATRARISAAVASTAAERLTAADLRDRPGLLPGEDLEPVLAAYLRHAASAAIRPCEGPGCDQPLAGRQQRFCSKRCEAASRRASRREGA
jgi:hypothetical protein